MDCIISISNASTDYIVFSQRDSPTAISDVEDTIHLHLDALTSAYPSLEQGMAQLKHSDGRKYI